MSVVIDKVLPEDAFEFTACHIACWHSAYKGIIPDDYLANMSKEIEQRTERTRKNLNEVTEDTSYYCAKFENKIIGFFIITKSRDEDKLQAGQITAIYLLCEFWNKGYGRQMMNCAIDALRNMGHREIIVWVLEENHRAKRFYEKCGFLPDGTKKEIEIGKSLIEIRYVLNIRQ